MNKLDFSLLKALYGIHAKSGNEKRIRRFIKRWVANNVPTATVVQDATGNLYITKGNKENYPCLCAHIDQVQDFHPKDFVCVESEDVIFGYSPKTHKQCGLGGDDKNGVFIALTCLQKYDVLKCAFFVGEEIGCVGSSAADMAFFDDCRFCAQIDRRGNSDLVTNISSPLCSDEFLQDARCEDYGYSVCDGLMTDVDTLRNNGLEISCVNMSCGYYEPHTDREITSKQDVQKCYEFVCHLIEDCTKVYAFQSYDYSGYSYDSFWDTYDAIYTSIENVLQSNPKATLRETYELLHGCFPDVKKEDFASVYSDAMWNAGEEQIFTDYDFH